MRSLLSVLLVCHLVVTSPSVGFSRPEIDPQSEALPAEVFRALEAGKHQTVVFYGTSVTIKGQWAKETESYLDTLYPGRVTFINSAKSGMHSNWGVENLKERVLDKHPDLVFLEFAINDAATKHGISLNRCRENLDTMVKSLQAENPQVEIVLQTMNPAWDSPKVPKTYASDRPHLEKYYKVYRSYAKLHHLPLVDNYPVWKRIMQEEPERYRRMVSDGIHPHSAPSREIAWPTVKALLDQARALAGGELTVSVWPEGEMPGKGVKGPEALRAPERTDAIRITNVSRPTLSLFPVEGRNEPAPAMIVCPGGGYNYVVVDKEGSEIAEWLNSIGINALVLKYRVPHNRAGALQDLQRALSLIRANAAEWKIDPNRIGVIGFSAGGHLCARASTQFDKRSYAALDEVDRQSCRPDFALLVYPAYLEGDGKITEDLNLEADIPPTLLVHNEDDRKFVSGSRMYAAVLKERKVPHKCLLYRTGGHGYGLRCNLDARLWPKDAFRWLRSNNVISGS